MSINRLLILLVLSPLFSCGGEYADIPNERAGEVVFSMFAMTAAQMESTVVHMFNGEGTDAGKYVYQIPGYTYHGNAMRMTARAGAWDMVLVNAERSALNKLAVPVPGAAMTGSTMWETQASGGVLPSMPEMMTAHVEDQRVVSGAANTGSALLVRNVARVKVVVKEAGGLNVGGGHIVKLGNVPAKLSWAGGLLPNKSGPYGGSMSGALTIAADPANSCNQISDTVTFIIPAHKGVDWESPNPADITTAKLRLSVDFGTNVGGRYRRDDVEIPVVPQMNKTLVVSLLVSAQLTVDARIVDWEDEYVNADVATQTSIQVSKTNVEIVGDGVATVFVKANADFTVGGNAAWIETRRLANGEIEISTDPTSFVATRSGYVTVTANNLTKVIKVSQRAGVGTISASSASFWLSPSGGAGTASRTITVNSSAPWTLIPPGVQTVTPNRTSGGAGSTNISFTRRSHTGVIHLADYPSYYGNTVYTLRNSQSLETITVTAQNLYLEIDGLDVPNAAGMNTKVNVDKAICYGGNSQFAYVPNTMPAWIHSLGVNNADKSISIGAYGEPTGERREGTITFSHSTDPAYRVTVRVVQDFLITIPPFHYFVIKYTWLSNDVDIRVQFEGNGANGSTLSGFDLLPLGWSQGGTPNSSLPGNNATNNPGNHRLHNGKILFMWGGDATGGQGETIFFNAPIVDNSSALPRKVKLVCYAMWYTTSRSGSPVRATIFAYLGGSMSQGTGQNKTNFVNSGGSLLYSDSKQQMVNSGVSRTYIKLVEITYDRVKHSAEIQWKGTELNTPLISTPLARSPEINLESRTTEDQMRAADEKK